MLHHPGRSTPDKSIGFRDVIAWQFADVDVSRSSCVERGHIDHRNGPSIGAVIPLGGAKVGQRTMRFTRWTSPAALGLILLVSCTALAAPPTQVQAGTTNQDGAQRGRGRGSNTSGQLLNARLIHLHGRLLYDLTFATDGLVQHVLVDAKSGRRAAD